MPPNLKHVLLYIFQPDIPTECKDLGNSGHFRNCLEMLESSSIYFPGFIINGKIIHLYIGTLVISDPYFANLDTTVFPTSSEMSQIIQTTAMYVHRHFIITVSCWMKTRGPNILYPAFLLVLVRWKTGSPPPYNSFRAVPIFYPEDGGSRFPWNVGNDVWTTRRHILGNVLNVTVRFEDAGFEVLTAVVMEIQRHVVSRMFRWTSVPPSSASKSMPSKKPEWRS
jgi:hypothetical protein